MQKNNREPLFRIDNIPLHLILERKTKADRKMGLNLNVYRNAHYYTLNTLKKKFYERFKEQIQESPLGPGPFSLQYSFFPSHTNCDLNNFISIIDKFMSDVLVKVGLIKDDNVTVISETNHRFIKVDSKNPRVELTIYRFTGEAIL